MRLLFLLFLLFFGFHVNGYSQYRCGAEVLINEKIELLKNRKIGLVTNHSAILSNKRHLLDTLVALNVNVTALFGPEHGIRGDHSAGAKVKDAVDEKTGITVYSLYGKTRKPSKEMLAKVDMLVYDIQDVGARFYTYISTLYYITEAAAEYNLPLIVLDRPNPLGGISLCGPVLQKEFKSFVGIAELPIQYGLTPGELAFYFRDLIKDSLSLQTDLTVVKLSGWNRAMNFESLNFPFVAPSPNLNNSDAIKMYPGTCLIEGTNMSEGRGTTNPFLIIGASYVNAQQYCTELQKVGIKGVYFSPIEFTPVSIPGVADSPKLRDKKCFGTRILFTGSIEDPVYIGVVLIATALKLYPQSFEFKNQSFDRLAGGTALREQLLSGASAQSIKESWDSPLSLFQNRITKFLLY